MPQYIDKSSGKDIYLHYVFDSAIIHIMGKTNGTALSNSIIDTGAKIGYDNLDGILPGCDQFAGYVTFRVVSD